MNGTTGKGKAPESAEGQTAKAPEAAQAPAASSTSVEPNLSRRGIFGAGFVGIATALVQACSGGDFASGTIGRRKSDDPEPGNQDVGGQGDPGGEVCTPPDPENGIEGDPGCVGGVDEADGGDAGGGQDAQGDGGDGGLGNGDDDNACYANSSNTVDVSNIEAAGPELTPTARFYGSKTSTMVALQFPAGTDIKQVIILRPTGLMLALHGISSADKKGSGYRPIVVDNINVGGNEIVLLLQLATERRKVTIPVAFFKTFDGRDVVDLSSRGVPADWVDNQSSAAFAVGAGFNSDPNTTYPGKFNNGAVRNLQTVTVDTSWKLVTDSFNPHGLNRPNQRVQGRVTDIMGNDIDIDGSQLLEYQIFCTYVNVGADKVYRTILQIA
jgi:hypothetical protein